MKRIVLVLLLGSLFSFTASEKVKVVDFETFEPELNIDDDKVHVINFWASWSVDCIKQLPKLRKVQKSFAGKDVEFVYVTIENTDHLKDRIEPLLEGLRMEGRHLVLTEPNPKEWITKVDTSWKEGTVPATLIYKKKSRYFHEGAIKPETITQEINKRLK